MTNATVFVDDERTAKLVRAGRTFRHRIADYDCTVVLEAAPGSIRIGKELVCGYGRVVSIEGHDGEELDVYIGGSLAAGRAYAIKQLDPISGDFDEYKIMVGFETMQLAIDCYKTCTWPGMYGGIEQVKSLAGFVKSDNKS